MNRRSCLKTALGLIGLPGVTWAADGRRALSGRVVVVGGGFGGATAAKYLRKWSRGALEVILIERQQTFVSCPTSNEVIGGMRPYSDLEHTYDVLARVWGVQLVRASVAAVDAERRRVHVDQVGTISYDRLILAPGIDFIPGAIEGYDPAAPLAESVAALHAWKAGPQTVALRAQLESMPDGGTFVMAIPAVPYRCPPGPYERACLVANYLKAHKPRAKVVVLDANEKIQSKEPLFRKVWEESYADHIEYHPNWRATSFDTRARLLQNEWGETQQGSVFNLIPPQRAADLARQAGVVNVNDRWAEVDWLTYESIVCPNIHVIGDTLQIAPQMPKSGHMANQQGKAVAVALLALFADEVPQPVTLANTCYSMVDAERGIHVASVHRYQPEKKYPQLVPGSGGISSAPSRTEGEYARAWARNIRADILG